MVKTLNFGWQRQLPRKVAGHQVSFGKVLPPQTTPTTNAFAGSSFCAGTDRRPTASQTDWKDATCHAGACRGPAQNVADCCSAGLCASPRSVFPTALLTAMNLSWP